MADINHYGIRILEINKDTRPIRIFSTAVIGLIATAEDAAALSLKKNLINSK